MMLPKDNEMVWEPQSSGKLRQTPEPRFRRNADRVKVRAINAVKSVFPYTCLK